MGQGIANAVGMAISEKILAAEFNEEDIKPIDHYTYAFLGDGCLMEGISHEACSFAGTHNLGKLICFYDENGISIDGEIKNWFTDDSVQRFDSYGWQTICVDGHNLDEINKAISKAKKEVSKPSMIFCKTTIGFGSPNKSGTADVHGAPLGEEEVIKTREALNWHYGEFEIPQEIYDFCLSNNLQVDFLVNNAGYGFTSDFDTYDLNKLDDFMNVLLNSLVKLTRLFLKDMKERKSGKILQVSSIAGIIPSGSGAIGIYGNIKNFINEFTI